MRNHNSVIIKQSPRHVINLKIIIIIVLLLLLLLLLLLICNSGAQTLLKALNIHTDPIKM